MTYFGCASHGSLARSLIFSGNPVALRGPSRTIPARRPMVSSPSCEAQVRLPSACASCRRYGRRAGRPHRTPFHHVQHVPTPPRASDPHPPPSCTGLNVLVLDQPDGTSLSRLRRAEKTRSCRAVLLVGLAERRGCRRPVDQPGNRLCAPPDDLRDVGPSDSSKRAARSRQPSPAPISAVTPQQGTPRLGDGSGARQPGERPDRLGHP